MFQYLRFVFISGPAPESVTNKLYELTKTIKEYKIVSNLKVDIGKLGTSKFSINGAEFVVEVIDNTADYVEFMKQIFDFPTIKSYVQTKRVLLNAMHGGKHHPSLKIYCRSLNFSCSL